MEQIDGYYSPGSSGVTVQETVAILWRRKWIALFVFLIMLGCGYRFIRLRKPIWTAQAEMMVTARGTSPETTADANTTAFQLETPETQIALIEGDEMAKLTYEKLLNDAVDKGIAPISIGLTDSQQFRLDFASAVKVVNPPDTSLLEVAVTSDNPARATLWANTVCQAFVARKKTLAAATLGSMLDDLKREAEQSKVKLEAAERVERDFKEHGHFVDFPSELRTVTEQYVAREMELQNAKQELSSVQANLSKVNSQIASMQANIDRTHQVSDPAMVRDIDKQLQDLEATRAKLKQQYRDTYPGIFGPLNAEEAKLRVQRANALRQAGPGGTSLADLERLKTEKIDGDRSVASLSKKIEVLSGQFDTLKRRRELLPGQNKEYETIARNSALAQLNYNKIQAQLLTTEVQKPEANGNVIITQEAQTPLYPSNLPPGRILLVFILFGILFAVGSAMLIERGDHRVRSVERVRALVSGPIVGTLPRLNPVQMRRLLAGETPPVAAEAYSLACANLLLALRHAWQDDLWHRQLVLITSAVPNEGKSITAAEVARFMARSGKSVILVDADMRRPTQRRLFNIDVEFGLADTLAGDQKVADLLIESDEPNLRLLPSGIVQKNPTALMSSPRMVEALDELRDLADLVIVDAPACAVVADAMLVAPHVDCIIQVVGAGIVSEKLVQETTEALRAAAPRTFAFIVNRAPNDRSRVYTPYYFKEYRGSANGNGHTDSDGIHRALPDGPVVADASRPVVQPSATNGNGHSNHEQITYALPDTPESPDTSESAEGASATDRTNVG